MMQQYSSTVAISQQAPQASTTATASTTTSIPPNIFAPNLPAGSNIWNNPVPTTEFPKIAKVAPTTSSQVNTTSESDGENNLDKPGTSKEGTSEETTQMSPEEEIRRRRLQKFQQSTTAEQPQE